MKCRRDPSDRVRSLKREVEALYQNNVRPGSNRKLDTEVFEMSKFNDKLNKFDKLEKQNSSNKFERKRQLWLSSCSQESGTSTDATYGRFAKDDDMITWWDEDKIILQLGDIGDVLTLKYSLQDLMRKMAKQSI